jgi:hypothetical protein
LARVCLHSPAQDAWAPITRSIAAAQAPDAFVLVATEPALTRAWFGEDPFGLASRRQLVLAVLDAAGLGALRQLHGGPGWALFDPDGILLADGTGRPTPRQIRERMEQAGWKPLRESLRLHLRDHPEDGQAWLESALDLAAYAVSAKNAGTLGQEAIQRTRAELLPCLRALAEMPGVEAIQSEPDTSQFRATLFFLRQAGLVQDPEIGADIRRLAERFPELIERDPEQEALWNARGWLHPEDPADPDALVRFARGLEGVPGRPWPPPLFAFWMRTWDRSDPEAMAREGGTLMERNLDPFMVQRLGRAHVNRTLDTWGSLRLEGLLLLKHNEEALGWLEALRGQAGAHWPALAARIQGNLMPGEKKEQDHADPMPMPPLSQEQAAAFRRILASPAPGDPPLARLVPLRPVVLEGIPPIRWGQLQIDPGFDAWDPAELAWTPLSQEEARSLKAGRDWPAGPRWALLQGDQLLATGPGLPTAATLDSALRAAATPRLETLGTFIKAHPDRLDARRERLDLIRPRLPNPRLEKLFLDDCETLHGSIGTLPFQPDPGSWRLPAKRNSTWLADRLQHGPVGTEDWRAYAQWSALDPEAPRPLAILTHLEPWPYQSFLPLPGPIPGSASKAVLETLLAAGRREEADAWCQRLWEHGLQSFLEHWVKLPPQAEAVQDESLFGQRIAEAQQILALWGKALTGRSPRAEAVRRQLETVKPGLAMNLGKPPS